MRTQRMITAVVLGLSVGFCGQAKADYIFATLNVPGSTLTRAFGINAASLIVGRYEDTGGTSHGFLYDSSGDSYMMLPDVPDSTSTGAYGINDSGQIVGWYTAGGTDHVF